MPINLDEYMNKFFNCKKACTVLNTQEFVCSRKMEARKPKKKNNTPWDVRETKYVYALLDDDKSVR